VAGKPRDPTVRWHVYTRRGNSGTLWRPPQREGTPSVAYRVPDAELDVLSFDSVWLMVRVPRAVDCSSFV